jgi:hypothetical protein
MKPSRTLTTSLLILIFFCGMGCGGLLVRRFWPKPDEVAAMDAWIEQRIAKESAALQLTTEQQEKLKKEYDEYRTAILGVRRLGEDRIKEQNFRHESFMKSLLTDQQRHLYQQLGIERRAKTDKSSQQAAP